jgi:hypothetical protein
MERSFNHESLRLKTNFRPIGRQGIWANGREGFFSLVADDVLRFRLTRKTGRPAWRRSGGPKCRQKGPQQMLAGWGDAGAQGKM